MTKENLITPVLVIGLSLAFITVSLLVSVFYKNPKLIKAKLRIGALIITLTACASTYSFSQKTCYKPAIVKEIYSFDNQSEDYKIYIHEDENVISGKIETRLSSQYYFTVSDSSDKTIQRGTIKAKDGNFDADEENFEIKLSKIKPGNYVLKVFSSKEKYNSSSYAYKIALIVEEKIDRTKVTCYYY